MSGILFETFLGLAVLIGGAELLLRGGLRLAHLLRIPAAIIGLFVVAWGTSTPTLVVAVQSATGGSPDIALGTVIGSVVTNALFILGAIALFKPMRINPTLAKKDSWLVVIAAAIFLFFCADGELTRMEGLILLTLLAAYTFYCYRTAHARHAEDAPQKIESAEARKKCNSWCASAYVLVGLGLLITGGNLLIDGIISLSNAAGIPEAVISVTLLPLGTTLAEFMASIVAARRGHDDIAVGNILGSNIFNLLGIAGLCAAFNPLPVAAEFSGIGGAVMLAATAVCAAALWVRGGLGRAEGMVFLALYVAHVVYQYRFIA